MSILNLDALNQPAGQETPPVDPPADTPTDAPTDTANPEPDQQVVVMDGPLSAIYTQALNLAYAREAASASGQTDIKLVFDEDIEAGDGDLHKALYVYCCDATDMTASDAVEGTNKLRVALDSKKYAQTYVVMESRGTVKAAAGLLEEYAVKNNVRVLFKRAAALEALCDAIR